MRETKVRRNATAFSALVHIIAIFVMVYVMDKGFQGVCIATSISLASRFVIAGILVWRIEIALDEENDVQNESTSFFSRDTFCNIQP